MTALATALHRRDYELAALRTVLGALITLAEAVPGSRAAFEELLAEALDGDMHAASERA